MPNKIKRLGLNPKTQSGKLIKELELIKASSDSFREQWDNEILKLVNLVKCNGDNR